MTARQWPADPVDRAAAVATLGVRGDPAPLGPLGALARTDPDPRVRAAALGALVRRGPRAPLARAWRACAADPEVAVRRRAAELAPGASAPVRTVRALLADLDPTVAEAAAWALGELGDRARRAGAVPALATTAREHSDPLVREAAVAALGALGDRRGLGAVLDACTDRPAVRRRAVLALAPFDGPTVDAALRTALDDPDRQVRQAAEDLLGS